jgi:DNA-binding CsgD family transcriptional regulator
MHTHTHATANRNDNSVTRFFRAEPDPKLALSNNIVELPPNVIYYSDDHSFSESCTSELSRQMPCRYTLVDNWKDLGDALEYDGRFLVIHADTLLRLQGPGPNEFINAIHVMNKCIVGSYDLRIGIIITRHTPVQLVKNLKKSCIENILLDMRDFSLEHTVASVRFLIERNRYWPGDIIKTLPGNPRTCVKSGNIRLTPRQAEVLELIQKRGASNKVIARSLGIAESTVKLHVSEIFKKYGVRNRTQLALFSVDKK